MHITLLLFVYFIFFLIFLSTFHFFFFFFNDTATTEIYTLSLHDALPIYLTRGLTMNRYVLAASTLSSAVGLALAMQADRKSTRLNSSHLGISYAVFCLKKKKEYEPSDPTNTIRQHPYREHNLAKRRAWRV